MAGRALWRGAITFSLVSVPVTMHGASRPSQIDLDLLDRTDFAPVGYQRYNKHTGKPVESDDIVKGYQYQKGEYVVLSDEDFRQANVEATRAIDIQAFVDRASILPQYFDTPYWLEPDEGAAKTYALLLQAMERANRIAVAKVVIRVREHLAALVPQDGTLLLNTLRFQDEIVPAEQHRPAAPKKAVAPSPKELGMALRLIDEMADDWRPEVFHDTYREDLMKRIEQKVRENRTHEVTPTAPEPETRKKAEVIDLVALLEKSLGRTKAKGTDPSGAGRGASRAPAADEPRTTAPATPAAKKRRAAPRRRRRQA
jgi:DNA end-binding protein Ku